jgi:hypothetical protein
MDRPASVEGLVVALRVEGESAEQLAVFGHDPDLSARPRSPLRRRMTGRIRTHRNPTEAIRGDCVASVTVEVLRIRLQSIEGVIQTRPVKRDSISSPGS